MHFIFVSSFLADHVVSARFLEMVFSLIPRGGMTQFGFNESYNPTQATGVTYRLRNVQLHFFVKLWLILICQTHLLWDSWATFILARLDRNHLLSTVPTLQTYRVKHTSSTSSTERIVNEFTQRWCDGMRGTYFSDRPKGCMILCGDEPWFQLQWFKILFVGAFCILR